MTGRMTYLWTLLLVASLTLGSGPSAMHRTTAAAAEMPSFKLDASWPKALPNNWILGQIAGIAVDAAQSCLFNVDGSNGLIDTLDRLKLELLASFGGFGRAAVNFNILHNFVVDSQGNIYTAEVIEGKRAQKFRIEGPKHFG